MVSEREMQYYYRWGGVGIYFFFFVFGGDALYKGYLDKRKFQIIEIKERKLAKKVLDSVLYRRDTLICVLAAGVE